MFYYFLVVQLRSKEHYIAVIRIECKGSLLMYLLMQLFWILLFHQSVLWRHQSIDLSISPLSFQKFLCVIDLLVFSQDHHHWVQSIAKFWYPNASKTLFLTQRSCIWWHIRRKLATSKSPLSRVQNSSNSLRLGTYWKRLRIVLHLEGIPISMTVFVEWIFNIQI